MIFRFLLIYITLFITSCSGLSRFNSIVSPAQLKELTQEKGILTVKTIYPQKIELYLYGENGQRIHQVYQTQWKNDLLAHFKLNNLQPQTTYHYTLQNESNEKIEGRFTTAPSFELKSSLSFLAASGLQNINQCHDQEIEMFDRPDLSQIQFLLAAFTKAIPRIKCPPKILLSDIITDEEKRKEMLKTKTLPEKIETFWAPWKSLFENNQVSTFLEHSPLFSFETKNKQSDEQWSVKAYNDYIPKINANHLWRSFHWGAYLEIFILDNQKKYSLTKEQDQYVPQLMGPDQFDWFIKAIKSSKATWKIIISDYSFLFDKSQNQILGGKPFAQEKELMKLVSILKKYNINKTVWFHNRKDRPFLYELTPFPSQPDFKIYEACLGSYANLGAVLKQSKIKSSFYPYKLYSYDKALNIYDPLPQGVYLKASIDILASLSLEFFDRQNELIYRINLSPP